MIIHRKQRKIISDADLVAMRAARADGESFRSIAKRFGRSVGTVARKIANGSAKRSSAGSPSAGPVRQAVERSPIASSTRLPHVTAEPFTREWYRECDQAFRVAMQREFPELTQTRHLDATPPNGSSKVQR